MDLVPLQIAVQVRDIGEARHFYREVLGCLEGRSDASWVGFNLYGHQFVCHLNPRLGKRGSDSFDYTPAGGARCPVPHCGVALDMNAWKRSVAETQTTPGKLVGEPYVVRFNDVQRTGHRCFCGTHRPTRSCSKSLDQFASDACGRNARRHVAGGSPGLS